MLSASTQHNGADQHVSITQRFWPNSNKSASAPDSFGEVIIPFASSKQENYRKTN